ncbi:MAG TPA: DMT family transporter [Gemmatimonadales bacterium]|nr:DMT family transporter [Gemmatimonadales bacterium]
MSPLLVLIVAVLATTYAGPIVRFATAPAVAIAFWRLVLVLPVTFGLATRERQRTSVMREAFPLMLLAGVLLAVHFWTWIASLRFTTVASSVVLVSLKPIFAWGIAALWLGEHPAPTERWGIALAVAGATLIGLGDARLSLGALGGDVLALAGALTGAGYYVIGRRVRRTVGIWSYASAVYAVAALLLGFSAALRGAPLTGFGGRDWTVFGAMAAGPMLLGHTGMNYALKHYRATTVNVAALGEPVGASLIAWLVPSIHEVPPPAALLGGILVLLGIAMSLGGESVSSASEVPILKDGLGEAQR